MTPHRPARRLVSPLAALALALAAAAAWAYVLPSSKALALWLRTRGPARGAVELPVRWGAQEGTLYAAGPGRHALSLAGDPPRLDPGPGEPHPLAPLWRALDLVVCPSAAELADALAAAGVELGRSGYARAPRSPDGVALTVGARGEGDASLPQVHLARPSGRPLLVRLPGSGEVRVGDPGGQGWPAWWELGDGGRLEVTGPPRPAPVAPAWATRRPPAEAADPPLPDWRGAFEGPRP